VSRPLERPDLGRRLAAEAVGTAFLLATVVGSGIMGERLAAGNAAVALLANTLATGAALVALILTFGPISGAHFNPAVTLADASQGGLPWRDVPGYVAVQILGAFAGVAAANIMFELPPFFASRHARQGPAQMFSEFVATWFDGIHPIVVVEDGAQVIAFASTSGYRARECYAKIAEFSVYVGRARRGSGAGRVALAALITASSDAGLHKLVSRIFPENLASRGLCRALGFREVGVYQEHGQLEGVWKDCVIVERLT